MAYLKFANLIIEGKDIKIYNNVDRLWEFYSQSMNVAVELERFFSSVVNIMVCKGNTGFEYQRNSERKFAAVYVGTVEAGV